MYSRVKAEGSVELVSAAPVGVETGLCVSSLTDFYLFDPHELTPVLKCFCADAFLEKCRKTPQLCAD